MLGIVWRQQQNEQASSKPRLEKEKEVVARVRGCAPWPHRLVNRSLQAVWTASMILWDILTTMAQPIGNRACEQLYNYSRCGIHKFKVPQYEISKPRWLPLQNAINIQNRINTSSVELLQKLFSGRKQNFPVAFPKPVLPWCQNCRKHRRGNCRWSPK